MARSRKRIKRSGTYIPDGLMLEILALLPIKSLHKFACVSKKWATIISQRRSLLPMSGLYLDYGKPKNSSFPLVSIYASIGDKQVECYPHSRRYLKFNLLNVCNGLFLYKHQNEKFHYCVTNPAANERFILPKYRVKLDYYSCLAYDPRESPHYKVLCFIRLPEPNIHVGIEVFSSITFKWVKSVVRAPISPKLWKSGSAYLSPFTSSCIGVLILADSTLARDDLCSFDAKYRHDSKGPNLTIWELTRA